MLVSMEAKESDLFPGSCLGKLEVSVASSDPDVEMLEGADSSENVSWIGKCYQRPGGPSLEPREAAVMLADA
jgi:hypothetical protein